MNRKIKILYLVPTLKSDGPGRQLVELVKGLDKERFDPAIYSFSSGIHYKEILGVKSVRVACLERKGMKKFSFPFKLFLVLKRERPDILHSYLHGANKWARLLGGLAGIPNIVTSIRNTKIKKKWIRIERLLYRLGKFIVVNSEAIKKELISQIDFLDSKIRVIPNGIDIERFKRLGHPMIQETREKLGLLEGDYAIAVVGRPSRQKNQTALLKALQILYERNNLPQSVKVFFAGESSEDEVKNEIEGFIRKAQWGDRCQLLPPFHDIERFYNAIDLLVHPSLWDGLPNAVLEAMACERPVIASEAANNSDFIADGVNGWIFRGDDQQLAELILKALTASKGSLAEMGRHGRVTVIKRFSSERMVKETERVYSSLMSGLSK